MLNCDEVWFCQNRQKKMPLIFFAYKFLWMQAAEVINYERRSSKIIYEWELNELKRFQPEIFAVQNENW